VASYPDQPTRQGDKQTGRQPFSFAYLLVLLVAIALLLALLPLTTLLLALGATLVVGLALLNPIFGVYWAILSVPVQEVVYLPGGLSYTQAAMLLAGLAWALRVLAHPEQRMISERARGVAPRLLLWVLLLWALLLAAALSPYSRVEGIKESLRWAEAFLVWLMIVCLARRRWHVVGLVACLLLAPAAEAAIGLVQFARGDGPPSFRIAPDLPFVRAYGTIGQPNSFAGYLNMAWPLALALAIGGTLWLWQGRRWAKDEQRGVARAMPARQAAVVLLLGCWLVAALILAGVAASLSRGAWVGAAIGALGLAMAAAVILGRRAWRAALAGLVLGGLVLAAGGAGLLPDVVANRLSSITRYAAIFDAGAVAVTPENFAVIERMSQLQAAWRMFLAYPLTGVGPGNYSVAYPSFAVGSWYASRGHAHNYYLHMAAEAGMLGLLAYLALLGGMVWQAIALLRPNKSTFCHSLVVGCCGIIAAVGGHNLFENLHVLSMGVQLAGVWGLLSVVDDT
jgi:O-antigen ligase